MLLGFYYDFIYTTSKHTYFSGRELSVKFVNRYCFFQIRIDGLIINPGETFSFWKWESVFYNYIDLRFKNNTNAIF